MLNYKVADNQVFESEGIIELKIRILRLVYATNASWKRTKVNSAKVFVHNGTTSHVWTHAKFVTIVTMEFINVTIVASQ